MQITQPQPATSNIHVIISGTIIYKFWINSKHIFHQTNENQQPKVGFTIQTWSIPKNYYIQEVDFLPPGIYCFSFENWQHTVIDRKIIF